MEHDFSVENYISSNIGGITAIAEQIDVDKFLAQEGYDGYSDGLVENLTRSEEQLHFLDTYQKMQEKNTSDKINMLNKIIKTYNKNVIENPIAYKSLESFYNNEVMSAEGEKFESFKKGVVSVLTAIKNFFIYIGKQIAKFINFIIGKLREIFSFNKKIIVVKDEEIVKKYNYIVNNIKQSNSNNNNSKSDNYTGDYKEIQEKVNKILGNTDKKVTVEEIKSGKVKFISVKDICLSLYETFSKTFNDDDKIFFSKDSLSPFDINKTNKYFKHILLINTIDLEDFYDFVDGKNKFLDYKLSQQHEFAAISIPTNFFSDSAISIKLKDLKFLDVDNNVIIKLFDKINIKQASTQLKNLANIGEFYAKKIEQNINMLEKYINNHQEKLDKEYNRYKSLDRFNAKPLNSQSFSKNVIEIVKRPQKVFNEFLKIIELYGNAWVNVYKHFK